ERERQRILNEALNVLKRMDIPLFPNVSGNKVGSKCHTVKNATAYIIHMMRQIEEHDRTHGVSAHLHQQSQLHQQRLQKQLEAMQQEELQYQLQQQQLYQEMLLQQSPQQQNHKQQNPQDFQQKQIQTPESQLRLCQQLDSQPNLHHQQSYVKLEPQQQLQLDQQQQTQELQIHCYLQKQILHQPPQFDHKPQLNQEQQQQQLLFQQLQKTHHHQPQIQTQQHRFDQHIPPLLKHKQSQLSQHQQQKPQYEPKQEHLYPQVQAQQPRQPKLGLLSMAQQKQQQAQLIEHFGKYHTPETYSFDVPKQHGSIELTPRFNSCDLPGLRDQVLLPIRPNEQVKSIYPHLYSQWETNHLAHPTFTLQHNPTPSTQPRQTLTPVPEGNFVAQLNPMNQAQCLKSKPKCKANSTKTKIISQATENTAPFARQLQSSTLCTENNISKQKRISGNTINFTASSGTGNRAGVNSKKKLRIAFHDKTNIVLNESNLSAFSAPTFDLCYPTADPRASCSTSNDNVCSSQSMSYISRATERHVHDANKEHPNSDTEKTDWLLDSVSVDQYFESLQN
ncbi:mediator of RNA polymerase II transcription subunit 26, partial [Biomphalaria pfeifferi]